MIEHNGIASLLNSFVFQQKLIRVKSQLFIHSDTMHKNTGPKVARKKKSEWKEFFFCVVTVETKSL